MHKPYFSIGDRVKVFRDRNQVSDWAIGSRWEAGTVLGVEYSVSGRSYDYYAIRLDIETIVEARPYQLAPLGLLDEMTGVVSGEESHDVDRAFHGLW